MTLLDNIQKLQSGLKRKEKRKKQLFFPAILDLGETHNRSYNADLNQNITDLGLLK